MPDYDREPDKPYTNREIREKWHDIANSLSAILVQTTTTNGRVSRLENWKFFITGGMSVIILIVVPMLGWALWVLVNIQGQVHSAVDDALSAYNIEK
jgi:cytochrome c-type biogenesis protein CcmH/NrfG